MAISKITSDAIDATDFNLDSNTLTIDATNNRVGVGTTSPSAPLEVNVSGASDAFILTRDTGTNGELQIDFNGANTNHNSVQGGHTFATNGTERMRIDSSGNLLVGTTTAAVLDNNGIRLEPSGLLDIGRDGAFVSRMSRNTSDGDIIQFYRGSATKVGSIGSFSGVVTEMVFDPRTNGASITGGVNKLSPGNQNGPLNNHLDLGSSSHRFKDFYLDGGVYLGGTGSANYLDDYEEGSWVPTVEGSSSNPTVTYTSLRNGNYVKIGKLVFVTFIVDVASISGGSGNTVIGALPYTIDSASSSYGNQSVMLDDLDGDFRQVGLQPNPNTTTISLIKNGGNTASHAGIAPNTLNAGTAIRGALTYRAA